MSRIFSIALIVILTASCSNTAGERETNGGFDLSRVQAHIHEMNKSYGERFRHNDMAFYNERYCKDIIIMPEQMPLISGIDSVRIFNYNEGRNKDLRIVVTATGIYGGPEVVVEEGIYDFPGEKGKSMDKGKFIAIWKQEDGQWKLFREIWNTHQVSTNN